MKITHVIERLDVGGAQSLLAELLPVLGERPEVEVTVVVYRSVKDSAFEARLRESPHVRFVNLDLKQTRTLSPIFRLVSEVREADVVHAHLFPALYHVAGASLITGTPAVYTEHNTTNRRRGKRWLQIPERMIYGVYSSLTAVGLSAAEALEQWIGREHGDVSVIVNGINLSHYDMEPAHPSQYPSIFGRSGKAIVMVARFADSKDHATLLRAIPYLNDDEAFVAMVGDGKTLPEMKQLATELGVNDRVEFLGERTDIPRILSASEVGVLSTHWEGMGICVVEMMAAGLPVVVTDIAGMREMLGDAGRLFPEGDERALSDLLNELLAAEIRHDAERMASSRRRAQRYDIASTADAYLRLYERIISSP
ncbi:MAG: glycosyltransferase [Muribaculaceae bacterium]|nr:glycosyltransferase [Muribaculaceae bacterium]